MVEVAVMIVKSLTMVGCHDDDGFIRYAEFFKLVEKLLDAGVHIGDGAVILCADVFLVGAGRREPGIEIVTERFECIYRIKRMVIRIEFVSGIKESFIGFWRQIRRMRIHMTKEEHERLIFLCESFELRESRFVH